MPVASRLDPHFYVAEASRQNAQGRTEEAERRLIEAGEMPSYWPPDLYPRGNVFRAFVWLKPGARLEDFGRVEPLADDVVVIEAAFDRLRNLAEHPHVRYIEAPRPIDIDLEHSVGATKADMLLPKVAGVTGLDGSDVVVGIVDAGGLDYTLDDFRDPATGASRIAYIWDQGLRPNAAQHSPSGYGYGVEYTAADIDAALRLPPAKRTIRHRFKAKSHATHVAGIAAGNGESGDARHARGRFVGVAPKARIIYVERARVRGVTYTNTDRIAQAVEYIFAKATALGMPCVINISQGENGGSHDGESVVERAIDRLLEERGRVLVKSAGNEGSWQVHAQGNLSTGDRALLEWVFGGGLKGPVGPDGTANRMEIWYSSRDRFQVKVIDPSGISSPFVDPDETIRGVFGGSTVHIISERFHPLNGLSRVLIDVDPQPQSSEFVPGIWRVEIVAISSRDGGFDAWIERDSRHKANGYVDQSYFSAASASAEKSITPPGTIRRGLTVANYDHRTMVVSDASGRGKTRDGRSKPDVAAPGTAIWSSNAGGGRQPDGTVVAVRTRKSGTSMSAPHVAGICAQLLQRDPTLTAPQIRSIVVASARPHPGGHDFHEQWGFGIVDAVEAEKLVR
jgi:subtilisin family serine protease